MSGKQFRPLAEWTPDCQGKQDYDGSLVEISTRYWPQGGGFHVSGPTGGFRPSIEAFPNIRPSAKSSIVLRHAPDEYMELTSRKFEADTEAEVKALAEAWVFERFNEIAALLIEKYAAREESG